MPEECRWSENILAPINKLFTRFKNRKASLREELRLSPSCLQGVSLQGVMLRRLEQLSAGLARREGRRPGSPHGSTHWLRLTALGHG